jgi:Ca-activated chloride channel family protein
MTSSSFACRAASITAGFLLWLVAAAGSATAAAPAAAASLDAQSGTLYLKSSPTAEPVEALRVATVIRAQVTGNVARVHVTQTFSNTGSDWVEGLYVFPLSADAAVDELLMTVGARTIHGEIHEKAAAEAIYAQARSEGRHAGIVDQERPNMFSTAIANIAPGEAVAVEIAYLETIPYRDSRYTLRLPLAITPRYTPGIALDPGAPLAAAAAAAANVLIDSARARPAQSTAAEAADAAEATEAGAAVPADAATATPERVTAPLQTVDVTVDLAPGFPLGSVASLHHRVDVTAEGPGKSVRLAGNRIAADHDFELVWTPAVGDGIAATAFAERAGADTFALLMLTPPNDSDESPQPREVTFIIDTSGSMEGPSIDQARAALKMGVDRLQSIDRFNVIRFASDYSTLFTTPRPVSAANRLLADRFIAGLRAGGGTEMRAPLEHVLGMPPDAGYLRQIVFITDGSVGNEAELLALIDRTIGEARLFTVGIGAAPNAYFLQQAALAGRGSSTFIAERDQVGSRMQDLFHKLERPALVDLKLSWPGTGAADLAAGMPRDLYAGDPLVILARLPEFPAGAVMLSGRLRGEEWVHPVAITWVDSQAGLSKLWARERIGDLGRRLQVGGDAVQLRASILELALRHHLVSQFTSLVAVDETVVRPPDSAGHVEQPATAAPQGSYWTTAGFAQTATPAGLLLLCGLTSIALGCGWYRVAMRRAGHPRAGIS